SRRAQEQEAREPLRAFVKKVFLIHGFEGAPNGGWRPWLMGELGKKDIYACALAMPVPEAPIAAEGVAESARVLTQHPNDEIYLVGHSLGSTAILRYLESAKQGVAGCVLISGPVFLNDNPKVASFLERAFDFPALAPKAGKVAVIQGDDDPLVPRADAEA